MKKLILLSVVLFSFPGESSAGIEPDFESLGLRMKSTKFSLPVINPDDEQNADLAALLNDNSTIDQQTAFVEKMKAQKYLRILVSKYDYPSYSHK